TSRPIARQRAPRLTPRSQRPSAHTSWPCWRRRAGCSAGPTVRQRAWGSSAPPCNSACASWGLPAPARDDGSVRSTSEAGAPLRRSRRIRPFRVDRPTWKAECADTCLLRLERGKGCTALPIAPHHAIASWEEGGGALDTQMTSETTRGYGQLQNLQPVKCYIEWAALRQNCDGCC